MLTYLAALAKAASVTHAVGETSEVTTTARLVAA
jgi:hypothetical protein